MLVAAFLTLMGTAMIWKLLLREITIIALLWNMIAKIPLRPHFAKWHNQLQYFHISCGLVEASDFIRLFVFF
jgi:hypothetical protein